jgi:isocitrate lyase
MFQLFLVGWIASWIVGIAQFLKDVILKIHSIIPISYCQYNKSPTFGWKKIFIFVQLKLYKIEKGCTPIAQNDETPSQFR